MLSKMVNKKNLYKVNITALAGRIGRTRTWTSLVWNGHEKSLATRQLIADALGIQVGDIWSNNNHNKVA
jgi:DNA-binding Xre family transcriptional regulator